MAVAAASSSSSSSSSMATEKHDVFLSFRGEDTRDNFTSHLYTALERRKVVTYIDNQLIRGEQISCGLLKAIEESKLWIVIFSQNYASSSWCLDELLHILECDHKLGRVVPVFYRVDPSCVRKQRGSYEKALDDLAKRYDADKLAKWKDALTKAANLSGWSTQDSRPESELVEKIVGDIIKKLKNMAPHIAFEGLVGVHQPVQQIESLLDIGSDDVRIIGIWGMAGIGKTTLAHAIFDKLDLPNLKYIDLRFSRNLIEMPDLSQAPNLEVLTLLGCRNFNNIPKIENIADLDLSGTAIEELPESIGSSRNLCKLTLVHCKSLQNIPSNIFQWESLKELNLSGCSSLKKIPDFPRLLLEDSELNETRLKENLHVPMDSSEELDESKVEGCISLKIGICQLKSLIDLGLSGCSSLEKIPELPRTLAQLDLSDTTIEEVPSSIELLSDLQYLLLRNCKRLRSLPTSICKLQSLAFLDLRGCSKFENFPEILKPMKGLFYLDLSETGIKDLPSSIQNLVSLGSLILGFCPNLKFVPISIYKLRGLTELVLSGFSELLNCNSPTVARLANLERLILSDCDMSEIPDNLLRSLQSIPDRYLSGKRVDTPRMKFPTLQWFCISNCKNLRSLPELPFDVEVLDARGCTSLETVSRSSIAILHQDRWEYPFAACVLFLNCVKLNESARSNIIADAQLRILRMATKLLRTYRIPVKYNTASAYICYPGNEIPEWYNYQASGSSINVVLPPNWLDSNFLGFTLCLVAAFDEHNCCVYDLCFECEIHLKTDTYESHKSNYVLRANDGSVIYKKTTIVNSDHVFFMYEPRILKACKAVEGTITEVSFHFFPPYFSEVKRCGIRLLYRQEADEHFASDPDYWKSDDEDSDSISEEIAEPSGSKLVLEYDRENEGDERPSKSEIVEEFGFAGDHDVAGESIAREDDVIVNNSSRSRGSKNLFEFEATDNNDESKSSISCGCLLFLSHVRGKACFAVDFPQHDLQGCSRLIFFY
ncbi:hypothetical protein TIFTF001_012413 [Ficus carica]|uniref:ADP-ribosyl cyclase/cyclic ADP-ribose hydrolase n=1 Tax=Ficus carica TaxID=3494 RepID=A0AA88AC96_FICCA|nr:hypothetical protein TIFTF001_012413 [Ficus carica]